MEYVGSSKIKAGVFLMASDRDSFDFNNYVWMFVGVAVWLLLARNIGTFDAFPINWFVAIVVVLGWFAGEGVIWLSRYAMGWFTCDGAAGSFNLNHGPKRVVDSYYDKKTKKEVQFVWLIYGLGAFNLPIPGKGRLETVIVPEMQVDKRFHNHQSKTKVAPISFAGFTRPPLVGIWVIPTKDTPPFRSSSRRASTETWP